MPDLLQHVIVTLVAAGAGVVVGCRFIGAFGVGGKAPRCDSCPSAKKEPAATTVIPLSSLRAPVPRECTSGINVTPVTSSAKAEHYR
jgi:hypothetical protein